MSRLGEIQTHLASMSALSDVVGAMRSLAAMRLQEAQHALPGIRLYAETMASAIADALMLVPQPRMPPKRGKRAVILCVSEQGFVGGFNERLVDAAQSTLEPTDALFALGSRGTMLSYERGQRAVWTAPMATRTASVSETVRRLTAELYARIARGEITHVEIVFDRYRRGSASVIERRALFPLDTSTFAATRLRQVPVHYLDPQVLFEKLAAEYVFARLTEAAVESIASENAARFATMDAAQENVSKKVDLLRQQANQVRQDEITTELLDLICGAEVVAERRTA